MNDKVKGALNSRPTRGHQHDNREAPCTCIEIDVMSQVHVGRHKGREAIGFRRVKQLAVAQLRPAALVRGGDFVLRQELTQRSGGSLIEQNAHLRWGESTSRSMI